MIPVRNPLTGEVGTIDDAKLQTAIDGGWQLATPAEVKEEKFGGVAGKAAAFGAGVASGATLGGSNVALRALAPEAADYVREASDVNPYTAGAGEVGGIALGMLAGSGEAGVLGKAVSAPTRLVTALGERAAERPPLHVRPGVARYEDHGQCPAPVPRRGAWVRVAMRHGRCCQSPANPSALL
jgi:hypothetical protein